MSGDPLWNQVVLLAVQENGVDTATAFDDASGSNKALTAAGNAQWDSAQAPPGLTSSLLLDGTGDYVSTPDHDDFAFGGGDFTVECWIRFATAPSTVFIFGNVSSGGAGSWLLALLTGALDFYYTTDGTTATRRDVDNTAWSPATAQWYHLAVSRNGANIRVFIDGVQHGATFNAGSDVLFNPTTEVRCGAATNDVFFVDGWIAAVRITKAARYVESFTPSPLSYPTGPLTPSDFRRFPKPKIREWIARQREAA